MKVFNNESNFVTLLNQAQLKNVPRTAINLHDDFHQPIKKCQSYLHMIGILALIKCN